MTVKETIVLWVVLLTLLGLLGGIAAAEYYGRQAAVWPLAGAFALLWLAAFAWLLWPAWQHVPMPGGRRQD